MPSSVSSVVDLSSLEGDLAAALADLAANLAAIQAVDADAGANLAAIQAVDADAATIQATINGVRDDTEWLQARWTNTRAGYLDNLPTLVSRLTATRAGYLDLILNLYNRLTTARAANLDNLDVAVSSRLSTVINRSYYGVISITGDAVFSLGANYDRARCLVTVGANHDSITNYEWETPSTIRVDSGGYKKYLNVIEFK